MPSINTNIMSLVAQKNMNAQQADADKAIERLSSGLRINHAADDAAGSAIASKMEAQVRSLRRSYQKWSRRYFNDTKLLKVHLVRWKISCKEFVN